MLKNKKILCGTFFLILLLISAAGCGDDQGESDTGDTALAGRQITVLSREDGSGTRDAFTQLLGISEKDANGMSVDNTTIDSEVTNSTSVMMATVAGNPAAIGYISMGSFNDMVKAVNVNGVSASAENVRNGEYPLARPFNIVTKDKTSDIAADFIKFIFSTQGQSVIEGKGYVSAGETENYSPLRLKGKIVAAGSSSVAPVVEALAEAYMDFNSDVEINVEQSDSTTGIMSAVTGICDIGLSSRELTDSEAAQGVTAQVIARDGIVVIVNHKNPADNFSGDVIKSIYTGDITKWDDILG